MPVENHYVTSSAISLLAYDDEEETLYVTFTDGRQYQLDGFPQVELERWLASGSIGKYWNANVKGRY
jgi:hypothetical protein